MEGQAVSEAQNKRMANLELLRCTAMMMVVVLHFLGKGGLLPELTGKNMDACGVAAWVLETLSIAAVNVYMFISGYFLSGSAFKLSRLIRLYLQVWVYSAGLGLFGALSGLVEETTPDTHYFLTLIFPVTMGHYWFMTAYVFMYLLLPFVGMAVRQMTKRQLQTAAVLLFLVFSIMKSVLPVRLEMDEQGYDCLWYLCVFVAAAYVRRFGVGFLDKKGRSFLLYVGSCGLILAGTFGLRAVYLRTGSLGRMLKMCLDYNHILPFLAAAGLFGVFKSIHIENKIANVINFVAPYTLGVYLLHENLGLRYSWQKWFGAERISTVPGLLIGTLTAVMIVFVCGVAADVVRKRIFDLLNRGLIKFKVYRRIVEAIEKVDGFFV